MHAMTIYKDTVTLYLTIGGGRAVGGGGGEEGGGGQTGGGWYDIKYGQKKRIYGSFDLLGYQVLVCTTHTTVTT
jgi:hypothetical protein